MMIRVFLIGALALTGCGPSLVVLEVHADLEIPNQVNSLHVTTLDAENLDTVLADVDFELHQGDTFPLDVLLDVTDETPARLRQRVVARFDGSGVARGIIDYEWASNDTITREIHLETVGN